MMQQHISALSIKAFQVVHDNLPAVAFLEGWRPELTELNTVGGLTPPLTTRATTPGQPMQLKVRLKKWWQNAGGLFIFTLAAVHWVMPFFTHLHSWIHHSVGTMPGAHSHNYCSGRTHIFYNIWAFSRQYNGGSAQPAIINHLEKDMVFFFLGRTTVQPRTNEPTSLLSIIYSEWHDRETLPSGASINRLDSSPSS